MAIRLECSQLLEVEVLVEAKHSLFPEEDERRVLHLPDPVVDEAHGVSKSTDNFKAADNNLQLGSLLECWVLVRLLVVIEECLNGRRLIGILPRQNGLHP